MQNLFSPAYWFTLRQLPLSAEGFLILLGLFFGFAFVGVALRFIPIFVKGKDVLFYRMMRKFSACFLIVGIIGIVFTLFAKNAIRIFGARFWFLLIGMGLFVWLGYIFNFALRVVPKRRAQINEYNKRKKYLPS